MFKEEALVNMEFVEEDEILPDITIREFLSIEKMLEYDPKFVQSSYNEIVDLIIELIKDTNRAHVFADLHKSIINPSEKILTDYTKIKVEVKRKDTVSVSDSDTSEDKESYIDQYNQAHKAPYYNLQQSQKALISTPFDLTTIEEETKNPIIDIPSTLILPTPQDIVNFTEADTINNTSIPVHAISWQPLAITEELYVVDANTNLPSSKFIKYDANKDPSTLHEWIEKRIEPTFKTTLENHISKFIKKIDLKNNELILDVHTIAVELSRDGYNLDQLNEAEFDLLINTLEELYKDFNALDKDLSSSTEKNVNKTLHKIDKLSKYTLFWDFLGSFKFPSINDEQIIQLRERCGNYMMTNNKYNVNENEIRKGVPYNMAMNIINNSSTLDDLLEYIDTYRNIIANNRIKNLLDDSPKTSIEQIDKPVIYNELLDLIKKFKLTEKSIIPENRKPFLDKYNEVAEFVEGNDTQQYDGTPFVNAQGTYDEDFEMGLVDDVLLNINEKPSENIMETGMDDAYELITNKYSEKYEAIKDCNSGILEVLATVLKQLIKVRDATGMKWSEAQINNWIKDINSNDIVKMRMSRAQQIKTQINDISEVVAQKICASTEQLSHARIQQITNSDLRAKLSTVYPSIHKEWMRACEDVLISGLSIFWLDSLEASVKGYLGFNILSGMVMFVNTWSPYGVPLEKVNKVGNRGIIYYIDAVANYVLKTTIDFTDEIQAYVQDHYNERLNTIKSYWKIFTAKRVQSRAEQAVFSLVELIKDLEARKKVSRNVIINTFIKSFVYLPLQLPIEDWNKYKKLPAWDLGCCTAKIDADYTADIDMKNSTKQLYKLKTQLARQRWNIEPRNKYQLFISKDKKHKHDKKNKDKENKENKEINHKKDTYDIKMCTTYFKPNELEEKPVNTTNIDNKRFDFIFDNTWFPQMYVSNILKDPKSCNTYLQNIISLFINNTQKANEINTTITTIKDIGSIINIVSLLIKNLFTLMNKYNTNSNLIEYNVYNNAFEITQSIKGTLIQMQNKFKGTEYTTALYISKYILAIAYCLPAQIIYDNDIFIDIPDGIDIDIIISNNYDIISSWKHIYKMPSVEEYNDYITKMREESKIKIMAGYNVLQDDDLQLMKDAKRFGLKVEQNIELNPDVNDGNMNGGVQDDIQDYEQEKDFYPQDPDMENANDDEILDRYM